MIKLLLLIPTLDRSGAEKQFALLATHLPREEFEVHAVALTRGGPYEAVLREHGIPLTVLHKRFKFDPVALWRLRRLVAKLNPDVIHSWLFAANAYARLVAGGNSRPKILVSERCVDTWKSGWQLWLDRRQAPRTTRLIGNSQGVADFYRQQGFPADRIVVIPNGIEVPDANPKVAGTLRVPSADAAEFPSIPAEQPANVAEFARIRAVQRNRPNSCEFGDTSQLDRALTEFNIPPGAKVVGYIGRLARQKRVKDLIWAMQLLKQLTDNVYFLLVGEGPERDRLRRFAEHLGCDNLVRFAGHREDAARLVQLMDVFWLASDFEGMSNSIMEAMAAGVPVVASDIPPNRELVVDGQTGFLVKVGDSVGFAQFADRLLADRDLARKLGSAGQTRMRDEFSIEKMVGAHAVLYREVVKEQKFPEPRQERR